MDKLLQKYVHKLTHLRQGVTKYGPAPHKPVFLLAVMVVGRICMAQTLEATSKGFGCTRERVRQVVSKFAKCAEEHFISVIALENLASNVGEVLKQNRGIIEIEELCHDISRRVGWTPNNVA